MTLGAYQAASMSVCAKSLPLNKGDSPVVFASAYAKQSPKFSAAGWLPLPYLRQASRATASCSSVMDAVATSALAR